MNLLTRTIRRIGKYALAYGLPVFTLTLILGDTAYAADVIAEDSFQTFLQKWGQFIAMIGSLFNAILWVVIGFISDLLNNDFIFGADMEVMLLSIWQTVRNFVNIAFVFVLLVIAFYNVVSIDTEKIPLRKSLGKLAIALILVNFSYFGAKVVLDVANVLTTAVFAIPRDIITEADLATSDQQVLEMCWKRVYLDESELEESDFSADIISEEAGTGRKFALVKLNCHIPNIIRAKLFEEGGGEEGDVVGTEYDNMEVLLIHKDAQTGEEIDITAHERFALRGIVDAEQVNEKLKDAQLTTDRFGRDTITMVLAKTLFDINKLTEVTAAASQGFTALTISGIVNLLLLLLYGAMFIAMFIVLIFRVVYLWVCIAFSPVVALTFVFKDFGIDMGEMDIQKLFIQYAFVPVKMGIAISAGTLMLFKAKQVEAKGQTATIGEAGEVTFDIPLGQIINDASIQSLMWQIATVAVVWIAVKWSMKDLSGPVSSITDKIFGYVGTLGELASKVPLTLPIIPYYNDEEGKQRGGTTVGQLLHTFSGRNLRDKLQGAIFPDKVDSDDLARTNRKLAGIETDALRRNDHGAIKQLKELTGSKKDMANIYNTTNGTTRVALAEKLQAVGMITEDQYKTFQNAPTETNFKTLLRQASKDPRFSKYFGTADPEKLISDYSKRTSKVAPIAGSSLAAVNADIRENNDNWEESGDREQLIQQIYGDEEGNGGMVGEFNDDMKDAFKIEQSGDGQHSLELTKKMLDELKVARDKVSGGQNVDEVSKTLTFSQAKSLLKKSDEAAAQRTAAAQASSSTTQDDGGGGGAGA